MGDPGVLTAKTMNVAIVWRDRHQVETICRTQLQIDWLATNRSQAGHVRQRARRQVHGRSI